MVCVVWMHSQGSSLLKNFGGANLYSLRFDDVTVFTQPQYDFVKLAKRGKIMEFIYFGDRGPSTSPGCAHGGGRCCIFNSDSWAYKYSYAQKL